MYEIAPSFEWTLTSPLAWFDRFCNAFLSIGYSHSFHNFTSFFFSTTSSYMLLLLNVDDIFIIDDDQEGILSLKTFLNSQFDMKDVGPLCCFLGIEVAYSP
eukprot:TRINITY_DN4795_c5_g1_i1.p1 TRINITY_DN4795_c5_g1~~TRINITY_DN4795_c5_g1_i1.p1  ORF type:complete len:101 (+),score=17.39 TRINITY_DN4795_c5_g1_i1:114-416(+)